MKVIVHQYVYVALDKTRSFVTIIDLETGEELQSKHYVSAGIPLIVVARDMYDMITQNLAELGAEIIKYRCNILGGFNLTKESGGYERTTVYNRHYRSEAGRLALLNASYKKIEEYVEEETEELEDVY